MWAHHSYKTTIRHALLGFVSFPYATGRSSPPCIALCPLASVAAPAGGVRGNSS
jgi:hypothetical protein